MEWGEPVAAQPGSAASATKPGVGGARRIAAARGELFFKIPDDEVAPLGW
jgi:hypothetical protein